MTRNCIRACPRTATLDWASVRFEDFVINKGLFMKRFVLGQGLIAFFLLLGLGAPAFGQAFPNKAITLVVPAPPGGVVDATGRLLGEAMSRQLGQPVVIDNRGGASGNIGYSHAARASADGYTLLTSYSAFHLGNPSLFPKPGWAQSDFVPIAMAAVATNVIAVHPSIPANTLGELIAYLRSNPDKVSYASQGSGSLAHVGTEIFKAQTATSMVHVPYRGSGPAIQDMLSGQVQLFITTPPSVMQHIQAGKLKGIAVTGKARHPGLPQVPTTAEAGLPGFELEGWVALFAPAGTPAEAVSRLASAVKSSVETPEVIAKAKAAGLEIRYLPPAALQELVRAETAGWATTIKSANISVQ
jgi:tripartite-type tricarboxylate transporter receptor subunit TctC